MNSKTVEERNLQVKKEILCSRPYPVALHHWTEVEFERFLDEHRFPRNTYADRLASRRLAVVQAIAAGEFVPAQVTAECPELVVDGQAARDASGSLVTLNAFWAERQAAFEQAIGFCTSEAVYRELIKEVLVGVLGRAFDDIRSPWVWGEWTIVLRLDQGRGARHGRFGLEDAGREKRLLIKPGALSVGALHCVDWTRVDNALFELLRDGLLCLDQVWFLTGTGWIPEQMRHARVTEVASAGEMLVNEV
ncbi:hypothetical protein [Paraburkholderia sp. SIMBA_054]|uniref:hypothetical protein n=1 Tax=Paraburkholderia sp. SIMBA_054 TaxID=3085795 RepID=UPI003978F934